ncbi:YdgH/BhsA/McbA family protein [Hyalangium gracile]|uniref:DUF1471 domain-containing protein n=1 Tax=Hyalangium gracile TaxID=394092 RepID=UPI001CCF9420|nr:DUF1471 domain-containing protein [Hyalangium gracile]
MFPSAASLQVEVKPLGTARPATDSATVVELLGVQALPPGLMFLFMPDGRRKLYVVPSYPVESDTHEVIAAMGVSASGGYAEPQAVRQALKAKAAELGANAMFQPEPGTFYAYALYVSRTPAPLPATDARALLQKEVQALAGLRPVGEPTRYPLASAPASTLQLQRGRCYAVAVALEPDARLSDEGERYLLFELASQDPLMLNRSYMAREKVGEFEGTAIEAPLHGRYLKLRSFSADLGCAAAAGSAELGLRTIGRSPRLGEGYFQVQLLERQLSAQELEAKVREQSAAMAQAQAEAREFEKREQARQAEWERERQKREAEQRAASSASAGGASTGGGDSGYYSFSIKNECSRTVRMFINDGGNPRVSSGESATMSSNSISSFSGSGPRTFWIVDDSGEGVSSFSASGGQRNMRILESCVGFAPR